MRLVGAFWDGCCFGGRAEVWVRGLEASREAGEGPCEFRWDAGLHLRAIEKRKMAPEKDAGAGSTEGNWYLENWERHSSGSEGTRAGAT